MSKKHKTPIERFLALPDERKEAEVSKYDRRIPLAKSRRLTSAEKKRWHKAVGRPTVGAGAKPVSVTIERRLLERTDRFAKRHKVKRSELIAQGLELVLKRAS